MSRRRHLDVLKTFSLSSSIYLHKCQKLLKPLLSECSCLHLRIVVYYIFFLLSTFHSLSIFIWQLLK